MKICTNGKPIIVINHISILLNREDGEEEWKIYVGYKQDT